jgi:hypothetical protein
MGEIEQFFQSILNKRGLWFSSQFLMLLFYLSSSLNMVI